MFSHYKKKKKFLDEYTENYFYQYYICIHYGNISLESFLLQLLIKQIDCLQISAVTNNGARKGDVNGS